MGFALTSSSTDTLLTGLSALPNPVVVVLLLKTQEPSSYFGMVWTGIAMAALLAGGLQLPVAGLYLRNIACCCSRRRKTFQGDIDWEEWHQEEMIDMKSKADFAQRNISSSSSKSLMPAYMHTTYNNPHREFTYHAR